MEHPNKEIMQKAIEIAKESSEKGNLPIAAIIVKGDKILSEETPNIKENWNPVGHAEINAIKSATNKIGHHFLKECYLYSTFEPCPMCTSAAIWAKMEGIVYGAPMEDETEKGVQRIKIKCREVIGKGTPKLKLHENFMRKECRKLLE
jgi:tRNA(Arg) A34 adenosine deaminase TadA